MEEDNIFIDDGFEFVPTSIERKSAIERSIFDLTSRHEVIAIDSDDEDELTPLYSSRNSNPHSPVCKLAKVKNPFFDPESSEKPETTVKPSLSNQSSSSSESQTESNSIASNTNPTIANSPSKTDHSPALRPTLRRTRQVVKNQSNSWAFQRPKPSSETQNKTEIQNESEIQSKTETQNKTEASSPQVRATRLGSVSLKTSSLRTEPQSSANQSSVASPISFQLDHSQSFLINEKLKRVEFQEFDSITTNVESWLNTFESKMIELNGLNQAMSIIPKYLDVLACEYYRAQIGEKPSIDWMEFKSKFKKYFTKFQRQKTSEAMMFSYQGGKFEDYVSEKVKLLRLVFPAVSETDLMRMAISSVKNDDSNSDSLGMETDCDEKAKSKQTEATSEKFQLSTQSEAPKNASPVTKASKSQSTSTSNASQPVNSMMTYLYVDENGIQDPNEIAPEEREQFCDLKLCGDESQFGSDNGHSDDEKDLDYGKPRKKGSSRMVCLPSKKFPKKRKLCNLMIRHLKSNYMITNNDYDKVSSIEIRGKLNEHLNDLGMTAQVSDMSTKQLFGRAMKLTFEGKVIYVRNCRSPIDGSYTTGYSRLKKKSDAANHIEAIHSDRVQTEDKDEFEIEVKESKKQGKDKANVIKNLVLDWLNDNCEFTKNQADCIKPYHLFDKINAFCKDQIQESASESFIGQIIKKTFGENVPYSRIGKLRIGYYSGIRFKDKVNLNGSDENGEASMVALNGVYREAIDWLKENYTITNDEIDFVDCQKLIKEIENHLKIKGEKNVTKSKIDDLVKCAFGELPIILKKFPYSKKKEGNGVLFYKFLKLKHFVPIEQEDIKPVINLNSAE